MINHLRKARKPWTCKRCGKPIAVGERHFVNLGPSLPYGRYIMAMVLYRCHMECATAADVCCQDARNQLTELGRIPENPPARLDFQKP